MATVNLRDFPDQLHRQLKALAKRQGTSVKWILIQAAKEYLKQK